MNTLHSAKRLTFLYFSIVALAIIVIHATVFELTTEDLEHIYAKNRLDNLASYSERVIQSSDVKKLASKKISTQGNITSEPRPLVYFDFNTLPAEFPDPKTLEYNQAIEVPLSSDVEAHFIMKKQLLVDGEVQDVLLTLDNSLYELSEEQLFSTLSKQLTISLALLFISLLVVLTISDKLTKPISTFARMLANKNPADLTPINLPKGTKTSELVGMVETFNMYQQRIEDLIERERAFNRYTSHELRTPLTVMSGAITLLGESTDKAFLDKQRQRLLKANNNMNEFIETLLNLTKPIDDLALQKRQVSTEELSAIIEDHTHLIIDKEVTWQIKLVAKPEINIPPATFHILVGNLIKNAFAYTESGCVTLEAGKHYLRISDTGIGLSNNNEKHGYGLGLLLVRDICKQFHYDFFITDNDTIGCTTTVHLNRQ